MESVKLAREVRGQRGIFRRGFHAVRHPAYLAKIVKAVIEAGATTINVPDTMGLRDP